MLVVVFVPPNDVVIVRSPFAILAGGRSKLRPGLCVRALASGLRVSGRVPGLVVA